MEFKDTTNINLDFELLASASHVTSRFQSHGREAREYDPQISLVMKGQERL